MNKGLEHRQKYSNYALHPSSPPGRAAPLLEGVGFKGQGVRESLGF